MFSSAARERRRTRRPRGRRRHERDLPPALARDRSPRSRCPDRRPRGLEVRGSRRARAVRARRSQTSTSTGPAPSATTTAASSSSGSPIADLADRGAQRDQAVGDRRARSCQCDRQPVEQAGPQQVGAACIMARGKRTRADRVRRCARTPSPSPSPSPAARTAPRSASIRCTPARGRTRRPTSWAGRPDRSPSRARSRPGARAGRRLWCPSFLIEHPGAGLILVDTGFDRSVATNKKQNLGRLGRRLLRRADEARAGDPRPGPRARLRPRRRQARRHDAPALRPRQRRLAVPAPPRSCVGDLEWKAATGRGSLFKGFMSALRLRLRLAHDRLERARRRGPRNLHAHHRPARRRVDPAAARTHPGTRPAISRCCCA